MKLIDADALKSRIERIWKSRQLTNTKYKTFIELLDAEPTIEPEIMDNLISRQAAIKIANIFCRPANIAKALAQLPSAQPEIIRCKDCTDYQTDWETSYPNRHYCATMDAMMPEDGFCSNAERREE